MGPLPACFTPAVSRATAASPAVGVARGSPGSISFRTFRISPDSAGQLYKGPVLCACLCGPVRASSTLSKIASWDARPWLGFSPRSDDTLNRSRKSLRSGSIAAGERIPKLCLCVASRSTYEMSANPAQVPPARVMRRHCLQDPACARATTTRVSRTRARVSRHTHTLRSVRVVFSLRR